MKLPVNYYETHYTVRKAVREEYVRRQKGLCHHCGTALCALPAKEIQETPVTKHLFPDNFFNWPIHLHHDHHTGMTIGAVHARCNAVLWEHHGE